MKTHDDDALDFEAEEGECADPVAKESADQPKDETKANESNQAKGTPKPAQQDNDDDDDGEVDAEEGEEKSKDAQNASEENGSLEEGEETSKEKEKAKKKKDEEELEEGEVSDEDEKRPEETEPKPVCRFYTRGQCTWGMSCRFLHPGVTDKGNYTMFESLVRSVPMQVAPPVAPRRAGRRHPPQLLLPPRAQRRVPTVPPMLQRWRTTMTIGTSGRLCTIALPCRTTRRVSTPAMRMNPAAVCCRTEGLSLWRTPGSGVCALPRR